MDILWSSEKSLLSLSTALPPLFKWTKAENFFSIPNLILSLLLFLFPLLGRKHEKDLPQTWTFSYSINRKSRIQWWEGGEGRRVNQVNEGNDWNQPFSSLIKIESVLSSPPPSSNSSCLVFTTRFLFTSSVWGSKFAVKTPFRPSDPRILYP